MIPLNKCILHNFLNSQGMVTFLKLLLKNKKKMLLNVREFLQIKFHINFITAHYILLNRQFLIVLIYNKSAILIFTSERYVDKLILNRYDFVSDKEYYHIFIS